MRTGGLAHFNNMLFKEIITMSFIAKVKRPILAFLMVLGLGAGVVSAADSCGSCAQPDYCTPVCSAQEVAPVLRPVCTSFCGDPSLARTDLPGWYSNDYDYSVSSQRDTGVSYLIPTMNGFKESSLIPLTNPVDQYYATHAVRNGAVVQTGQIQPTGQLASL